MNLVQLFCCHHYQKVGFRESQEVGIRYSIRKYKCSKFGLMADLIAIKTNFEGNYDSLL